MVGPTSRLAILAVVGCSQTTSSPGARTLRPACTETQHFNGSACVARPDGAKQLAIGVDALANQEVEQAKAAFDAVEHGGPLDYATHVRLWEQRGIAAAYIDDETGAGNAFDMLLALDPTHFLSYELSLKATLLFEKALNRSKLRPPPALDLNWPGGHKVGDPVPIDVEVLADPKQFLSRATLFVRTRGEASWRATDLVLATDKHIVLPPVKAETNSALELYLRAYDARGNEVLNWADATRPREIVLRYDPPRPWYFTWWGLTSLGVGTTAVVATIVYFATRSPPDKIDGGVMVQR